MHSQRIESLLMFGWRFGLGTIRALLDELHDPLRGLTCVHVAGTNGKGATCAYVESILRAAGYRTGLYTSPHLSSPRERFRINGVWIPSGDYERLAGKVLRACRRLRKKGLQPTYFEAHTALAALWFKQRRVDVAIMETGLGGRLDATNAIDHPAVCLLTSIGEDHRDILGPTLENIAREKAGILKTGCLSATIRQSPSVQRVLRSTARRKGAFLCEPGEDFRYQVAREAMVFEGLGFRGRFDLKKHSPYDGENAALAVAGVRLLANKGFLVGANDIQKGFSNMSWPGRFETVRRKPLVLLDGAHNPPAFRALARALRTRHPKMGWIVLNGFLDDKEYPSCLRTLRDRTVLAVVTRPPSNRAADGRALFERWESWGVPCVDIRDWRQALSLACSRGSKDLGILVTGSLYLVGACREVLCGTRGLDRLKPLAFKVRATTAALFPPPYSRLN